MKLIEEIRQRNESLLLRRAELHHQLGARINAQEFRSFFITFVAAPFLIGAIAKFSNNPQRQTVLQLWRLAYLV